MPEYITGEIEIYSNDSDREDFDEENSDEENSNEENQVQNVFSFYIFDVSNEKKLLYLKHFESFIKCSYICLHNLHNF